MVIQRDSFYYLKNQSADLERQVDVLRKINEYERFIDGICLGLDVSGSSRGSDSRREGRTNSPCSTLGSVLANRVPCPERRGSARALKQQSMLRFQPQRARNGIWRKAQEISMP